MLIASTEMGWASKGGVKRRSSDIGLNLAAAVSGRVSSRADGIVRALSSAREAEDLMEMKTSV
jgi:hypothetical protein